MSNLLSRLRGGEIGVPLDAGNGGSRRGKKALGVAMVVATGVVVVVVLMVVVKRTRSV